MSDYTESESKAVDQPPENWWWTTSSEEYGTEVFGPYDSYDDADDGITRVRKKVRSLQDDITRWYSDPVSGPKPAGGE